jgi:CheY-like chemotaxis protein
VKVGIGIAKPEDLMLTERAAEEQAQSERMVGTFQADGEYAYLSVEDNGTGISPEVLDRIFDPFFTTKQRARGTGLGLAVVHGVVTAHKAVCRVTTRPGIGTMFSVYFPRIDAVEDAAKIVKADIAEPAGRRKVILVDDEEDVLEALKIGLSRRGLEVQAYHDPFEALAAIARAPDRFDVLVADQTMPGLEGDLLILRAKAIAPGLKAIICTGKDTGQIGRLGVDAVIAKPVDLDDLANVIR